MTRFVVHMTAGMCGTEEELLTEDNYTSEEEVYRDFEPEAWEHFWNFNDESDVEPELDMWVEEFDPEVHAHLV